MSAQGSGVVLYSSPIKQLATPGVKAEEDFLLAVDNQVQGRCSAFQAGVS